MRQLLHHIFAFAFFSTVCAPLSPAFAQGPQTRAEENCGEIARNYELIKADAVSIQTNMALFAAADRGCDDLARRLLDSGASLQARDRRGAMPLAYAARSGQIRLVEFFLAQGAPIDARNVDGETALYAAAQGEKKKKNTYKHLIKGIPGRHKRVCPDLLH